MQQQHATTTYNNNIQQQHTTTTYNNNIQQQHTTYNIQQQPTTTTNNNNNQQQQPTTANNKQQTTNNNNNKQQQQQQQQQRQQQRQRQRQRQHNNNDSNLITVTITTPPTATATTSTTISTTTTTTRTFTKQQQYTTITTEKNSFQNFPGATRHARLELHQNDSKFPYKKKTNSSKKTREPRTRIATHSLWSCRVRERWWVVESLNRFCPCIISKEELSWRERKVNETKCAREQEGTHEPSPQKNQLLKKMEKYIVIFWRNRGEKNSEKWEGMRKG